MNEHELEALLPDPQSLVASAPNIKPTDDVSRIALRRSKVRELMRMGYEAHQIVLVIEKGIKISTDEKIDVPVSEWIVKNDMEYIRQEDVSADVDLPGKRAEILDKLRFLYNQAIREYMQAKGPVKNSFLNTALTVLGRISDLEGLKQPDLLDINGSVAVESKLTKFSAEIHALGEEDRNVLVSAIRQVLGNSDQGTTEDDGVPSESPALPAQTSDDERIPGKS
jgi:hypothetical protein